MTASNSPKSESPAGCGCGGTVDMESVWTDRATEAAAGSACTVPALQLAMNEPGADDIHDWRAPRDRFLQGLGGLEEIERRGTEHSCFNDLTYEIRREQV